MVIVRNRIIPFKGYKAMALYPCIFVHKGARMSEEDFNHEYIHLRQQRELWFVGFYLWYGLEWAIKSLRYRHNAYRDISFEREAYLYDNMPTYLEHRRKFAWMAMV